MKTNPLLAAAVALVTVILITPNAKAGHGDDPAEFAHALESDAWTTVSMFDDDLRHDGRRQNAAERAFHDHLIELKHDLHEIGEALDHHNHHSAERSMVSARHTLNCAVDLKRSVHLHRETDESFCHLVRGFGELEERLAPRDHRGHDHTRAPEPCYEERRPVQTRYSNYDSREVDPRQLILRSILSHFASR